MNFLKHHYLLETVRSLQNHGSWTGKTHVIKTLAMVDLLRKTPFDFILYKHGPYSFDVDDELSQMRTYDAVKTVPQGSYGPSLKVGQGASFVQRTTNLPSEDAHLIDAASSFLADKPVSELEAIVTSAWIILREGIQDNEAITRRLIDLKPHISIENASEAAKKATQFVQTH